MARPLWDNLAPFACCRRFDVGIVECSLAPVHYEERFGGCAPSTQAASASAAGRREARSASSAFEDPFGCQDPLRLGDGNGLPICCTVDEDVKKFSASGPSSFNFAHQPFASASHPPGLSMSAVLEAATAAARRGLGAAFKQAEAAKLAMRGGQAGPVAAKAAATAGKAAMRGAGAVHGVVQRKLFEGEAPTLHRFRGDKYSHCNGAPQRNNSSLQHLAPYLASGVLAGMLIFFVAFPLSFNSNYNEQKKRYEGFAKQHQDQLNAQFDRGQFNQGSRGA
mmetsp:Transcript_145557/g.465145  ORF Transcript_145557/g.465145 Transcript_145557/m.465145 type:complete len:279 (-) Transcript_145557:27-863(-)